MISSFLKLALILAISTFAPAIHAGVVAHYLFDGDFADSSGQGNTGIPYGAAAISTSPADIVSGTGALFLDGQEGSHVTLTNPGFFSATQPWTISWWARRDEIGGSKGMVIGKNGNTSDFIWLNDASKGLRFRSSTSKTFDFTTPQDTNFRHYALVADGAGNLSLYLDGIFSETGSVETSFSIDTIGDAYSVSNVLYNFQGILDELRVIPASSDAAQIRAIYDSEKPEVTSSAIIRVRVILIGGQSNADGRAPVSGLSSSPLQSPQADVDLFYKVEGRGATFTTLRPGLSETGSFGPEISLGRHLADLHAGEAGTRVALIKYANGGTNLHLQWAPGGNGTTTGDGPEYLVFQQTVTSGLAALTSKYPGATIQLQGMVWMQGESDVSGGFSSFYQQDLTKFITDIRATYGSSLPFIIGKLSSLQTALSSPGLATVRAAQESVAAADPRTAIVITDSYGINADNLHFSASGQLALGRDFLDQAAYYEWMLGQFSSSEIDSGNAEPNFDADGDGRNNRSEFIGGTDPQVPGLFVQADFEMISPTSATISYDTSLNRTYAIERWEIATGIWRPVLSPALGTGARVDRPLTLSSPVGLFRVRIELP